MSRYAVVFKRLAINRSEASQALKCRPEDFTSSAELLRLDRSEIRTNTLIFEKAGVCYAQLDKETADSLSSHGDISHIRPIDNITRDLSENPASTFTRESFRATPAAQTIPWHIKRTGADRCWGTATGQGVKVGIIDSEIDNTHPDLPIAEGESFHPDTDNWYDGNDFHGTFCAGIVGARNNGTGVVGVTPDCDLYALRVNKNGSGNTDYIFAAMMWAANRGLDVVSISQWKTSGADNPHEAPWPDMVRGAEVLNNAGCSVVGIAGNSGGFANHWVTNPGRCPNFIAVGGTQSDDTWWYSSSYGPDGLDPRMAVELVAPGSDITSTIPGGGFASGGAGTSFACPHVTGLIALLKELHQDWSPDDILQHMKSTAIDLGPAGPDVKHGIGLIDAYSAVVGPVA